MIQLENKQFILHWN